MSGVIVGVDDSETARRAVRTAATYAETLGVPLRLVTAAKLTASETVGVGADTIVADGATDAAQFLQALKLELKLPSASISVGSGDPSSVLCDAAAEIDATLIVVGNRRVQGARRVLGSIATAVLRHATCDVLVAHTTGEAASQNEGDHRVSSAKLFFDCTAEQRTRIDALATSVHVKKGVALASEGQPGKQFGLLLEGTATVSIGGAELGTIGAGDFFGEIALLSSASGRDGVQTATVVADTDLQVAVMSFQEFESLMSDLPDIAAQLRRVAERRAASKPASS